MTDYTPGWSVLFPEPHERDEQPRRATGPRHESAICYECGADCDEPVTFDGHTFCSREHLDSWVRR